MTTTKLQSRQFQRIEVFAAAPLTLTSTSAHLHAEGFRFATTATSPRENATAFPTLHLGNAVETWQP